MGVLFEAEFSGVTELTGKFAKYPAELDAAEKRTVRRTSLEALADFRRNVNPPTLRHRSGHLAASTNAAEPVKDALGWGAAVGYRRGDVDKYAGIQEGIDASGNYVDATTIRAKKRLLAIPIDEALTGAGVARFKGPRDFEGVNPLGGPGFWIKFNASLFFVVPSGAGKNQKLHFLFLGVPQVKVPGRKPLRNAAAGARARMRQIAFEELAAAARAAGLQ